MSESNRRKTREVEVCKEERGKEWKGKYVGYLAR